MKFVWSEPATQITSNEILCWLMVAGAFVWSWRMMSQVDLLTKIVSALNEKIKLLEGDECEVS